MQEHTIVRAVRLSFQAPDDMSTADCQRAVDEGAAFAATLMPFAASTPGAPLVTLCRTSVISPHDPAALEAASRKVLVDAAAQVLKAEAKRIGQNILDFCAGHGLTGVPRR